MLFKKFTIPFAVMTAASLLASSLVFAADTSVQDDDLASDLPDSISVSSNSDTSASAFASRKAFLMNNINMSAKGAYDTKGAAYYVNVLFKQGKEAEAKKMAEYALDRMVQFSYRSDYIAFNISPFIDMFVRNYDKWDPAFIAKTKAALGQFDYGHINSSNLRMMMALGRYLGSQTFGEAAYSSKSKFLGGATKDPIAEKHLRGVADNILKQGIGEYHSRPYGQFNMGPLLTLMDTVKDPVLAKKARDAYEFVLAENASVWLKGHLAATSGRTYPDIQNQYGGGLYLWTYFGGKTPSGPISAGYAQSLVTAVSNYTPPSWLNAVANDRSQPYVNISNFGGAYQYSFINKSYGIYTQTDKKKIPFWQTIRSGVAWTDENPKNATVFWLTHPLYDDAKQTYGAHTHGTTKFEQTAQYRHSIVANYDTTKSDLKYALSFVPGGYQAMINDAASGKVYLYYADSVMIAINSSIPFKWDPVAKVQNPTTKLNAGDSEFRINGDKFGVAIETARADEVTGTTPAEKLANFKNVISSKSKISYDIATRKTTYIDRFGNKIENTFDGGDAINGVAVDYKNWPLLENPWLVKRATTELTVKSTMSDLTSGKWSKLSEADALKLSPSTTPTK